MIVFWALAASAIDQMVFFLADTSSIIEEFLIFSTFYFTTVCYFVIGLVFKTFGLTSAAEWVIVVTGWAYLAQAINTNIAILADA